MRREPITLPPLTPDKAEAPSLGLALGPSLGPSPVSAGADPSRTAAAALRARIAAVVPARPISPARCGPPIRIGCFRRAKALAAARHLPAQRRAIRWSDLLRQTCVADDGTLSARTVWPLGPEFWGPVWTLAAWCETRHDFRGFRVDRLSAVTPTGQTFTATPGQTLANWRARHPAP